MALLIAVLPVILRDVVRGRLPSNNRGDTEEMMAY